MKGSVNACDLCKEIIPPEEATFYLRIQSRERDTCYKCTVAMKRLTENLEDWLTIKVKGEKWLDQEKQRLLKMEQDLADTRKAQAEAAERVRLAAEAEVKRIADEQAELQRQALAEETERRRVEEAELAEKLRVAQEQIARTREIEEKTRMEKLATELAEKEAAALERKAILDALQTLSEKVDNLATGEK